MFTTICKDEVHVYELGTMFLSLANIKLSFAMQESGPEFDFLKAREVSQMTVIPKNVTVELVYGLAGESNTFCILGSRRDERKP